MMRPTGYTHRTATHTSYRTVRDFHVQSSVLYLYFTCDGNSNQIANWRMGYGERRARWNVEECVAAPRAGRQEPEA